MAAPEIYPWSQLQNVGDFFIVLDHFKKFPYISMMISQRNYKMKGEIRYSATRLTYGTLVAVVQYGVEEMRGYEYSPGVLLPRTGVEVVNSIKEMSQSEKIQHMSIDDRMANLPWWENPKIPGTMLMNVRVMTQGDIQKYMMKRQPHPLPDDPYPDYYDLDDNLRKRPSLITADEEPEEDWGDQMFEPGEADHDA
jgi:hypothetical protein